jgi:nucleoprotein TPR
MAAPEVDFAFVAGHLGLGQETITTVATQPTVELITAVLLAIENRAREVETEQINKEVEFEQLQRRAESQSEASKAQADQALREVEEARHKLQEEGRLSQSNPFYTQHLRISRSRHILT